MNAKPIRGFIEFSIKGDKADGIRGALYPQVEPGHRGLSADQVNAVINATRTIGLKRAEVPDL